MKSLSRSTPSFAGLFRAVLVFVLAAATCDGQGDPTVVTICFRGRTIQVPAYLRDRYLASGATLGICPLPDVIVAPVFVTPPQPATRYVGGSVTFTAAATGTPTPTYQWHFNGIPIPGVGATAATLTLSNLQLSDAGNYMVTATNPGNIVPSTAAQLTVLDHVVTTTADAGPGSLREVIASAPATTSIRFADQVRGIITLTSGELLIDKNLIIIGPGADLLTVRRGDAAADFRILRVEGSQPSVTLSGLTLANGRTTSPDPGGGIKNAGSLTLRNCSVSGNSSPSGDGGAIFSATGSSLDLDQCTLSQNSAGQGGGGILAMGSFSATNCTFSGNSAPDTGGIHFLNSPSASLHFCTVTGNASLSSAATHAGGIHSAGSSVSIGNTIVAGNIGGPSPDIIGTVNSGGNNLIGDGGASVGLTHGVAQDLVGTAAVPVAPLLDILKINGGPTETHALLPGSPAINAANPATAPAHDQRGVLRSGVPDIGAYEVSPQIFTPKNIELNVSFLNTDQIVTDPMSALGGPGLKRIYVTATTDPAPQGGVRQALKDYDAVEALSAPTDFIVDDTTAGLAYSVQVLCELNSGQQYYFPPVTGLSTSGAPPQWEIANMATLVNFHFVDQANQPVELNGGLILAHDLNVTNAPPSNLYLTSNATGATFLARGGSFTRFILYADLGGTDPAVGKYRKKYTISTFETTALRGGEIEDVTVMIDTQADTTGSLTGVFDVTRSDVSPSASPETDDGFFEILAPTPIPNDSRPDYPLIHATFVSGDGYGNWERETPFVGDNFTLESSGGFTAANLLPSPPPTEGRYIAYGETFLRRTVAGNPPDIYGLQFFRTPILGYGSNPAPQIPAGPLNTGEIFVIKPGYLTGSLALVGPPVIPGKPAMLAHVARSTAGDTTGDGLPDTDVTEWFCGSVLWANGLDEFAADATATASGGQSFLPLPGSFNSATGEFTGNYNFALGGLNGEGSVWKADSLLLSLVNHGNSEATYFDTAFTLTDLAGDAVLRREITAGATAAVSDITRTFGEVILTVRNTSGTLYQPDIRRVIDDPAYAPNPVALENFVAFGWPTTQAEAAETGSIRTLLPAGKWLIYPRINPGDQPPGSNIDLQPVAIDVPARGRLSIEPDFSLQVAIPECLIGPVATITGSVASSPVVVAEIHYSIDGGPEIPVGEPNSADPEFSIDLSALTDGDYSITITATGANGEESSFTTRFRRDSVGLVTQKAVILRWNQGILQTSTAMSAWTDVPGATSPLAVPVSEPKRFWQTLTTIDPEASTLAIEKGVLMTWACGVLQTSTNGVDWTDVPTATSPFAVPDGGLPVFWQVRSP